VLTQLSHWKPISFNPTVVRLEGNTMNNSSVAEISFNLTVVRLEDELPFEPVIQPDEFQSYSSPIRRVTTTDTATVYIAFQSYSSPIRSMNKKEQWCASLKFQSYSSPIRSEGRRALSYEDIPFQSYSSPIRSLCDSEWSERSYLVSILQ